MIDFIIEVIFTPSAVWLGLLLGALAAAVAWYLLPEAMDKASIGAWFIGLGFVGGLFFCLPFNKEK